MFGHVPPLKHVWARTPLKHVWARTPNLSIKPCVDMTSFRNTLLKIAMSHDHVIA